MINTKIPLPHSDFQLGYIQARLDMKKDFREKIQKFKKRRWINYGTKINCERCGRVAKLYSFDQNVDYEYCFDCALEQDFGKELMEERK
jgi:late competence protein required for DNA uptake (superfamily II DNA/RNA helicase)